MVKITEAKDERKIISTEKTVETASKEQRKDPETLADLKKLIAKLPPDDRIEAIKGFIERRKKRQEVEEAKLEKDTEESKNLLQDAEELLEWEIEQEETSVPKVELPELEERVADIKPVEEPQQDHYQKTSGYYKQEYSGLSYNDIQSMYQQTGPSDMTALANTYQQAKEQQEMFSKTYADAKREGGEVSVDSLIQQTPGLDRWIEQSNIDKNQLQGQEGVKHLFNVFDGITKKSGEMLTNYKSSSPKESYK